MASRDEILARLNLRSTGSSPAPSIDPLKTTLAAKPTQSPVNTSNNLHAFKLDSWGIRRGEEIARKLRVSHGRPDVCADFHESMFDPQPELEDTCQNQTKLDFIKAMMGSPEFNAIRNNTVHDTFASGIAVKEIVKKYSEYIDKKELENSGKTGQSGIGGSGAEGRKLLLAAGNALSDAMREVETAVEGGKACGLGAGAGSKTDTSKIANLYDRIRRSENLRRIFEKTGRYRMVMHAQQRVKTHHGQEDLMGIKLDGEISQLIPSELMSLCIPELEESTYRRIMEREAACWERGSYRPKGKGPGFMLIDESGSMGGAPIENAKALGLAFAMACKEQNRWCALVGFSGYAQERVLILKPGQWDDMAICDWLEGFWCGGTVPPVGRLIDLYNNLKAPKGITDITYVTDGYVYINPMEAELFNKWRKEETVKAKVTTLSLGCDPGQMHQISDEVMVISHLDPTKDEVSKVLGF